MRILLVGAGGVGSAFVAIARRREFFEACLVTDHDEVRAQKAVAETGTRGSPSRASMPPAPTRWPLWRGSSARRT